jgi:hypothetical protein
MKNRIIRALLRIYSAAWRNEYGPEFQGILETRSLKTREIFNVAWNAAWQRIRATEPWVLIGLAGFLLNAASFTWLIVAPPPYSPELIFPPHVSPLRVAGNLLVVMACGFWTVARSGGTLPHAGVQTMKMTALTVAPALVVCALVISGALGVVVLGPGDVPTTVVEHGFAIAWYDADGVGLKPMAIVLFILAGLLENWIWGALGGAFGRLVRKRSQTAA